MTERIAGRRLQRIRRHHLWQNPLCVHCFAKGRIRLWTELDHIEPLKANGGKGDDILVGGKGKDVPENRQGLCAECHAAKTAKDMGYQYRPKVVIGKDGWPVE